VNTDVSSLPRCDAVPTVSRVVTGNLQWQRAALCRGEAGRDFYPPFGGERKRDRKARELRAKAVCESCPVRAECLDHAVSSGERYGVWGGLTSDERSTWRRTA
jgi:WhiB family transcriptional regulator, redox-sensing transcriptional regulator